MANLENIPTNIRNITGGGDSSSSTTGVENPNMTNVNLLMVNNLTQTSSFPKWIQCLEETKYV